MRTKEKEQPIFDITDRGFNVKAWYIEDTETEKGDALIEIRKDDKLLREFLFPAYKIYNIAAHFKDIVDSELAKNTNGYGVAASTGLGGSVGIKEIKKEVWYEPCNSIGNR